MLVILYHNDFDGAASAALLAQFLVETGMETGIRFVPVDHDKTSLGWEQDVPPQADGEEFAIVDFKYHPAAKYFFDHHPTAFPTSEWREHYEQRVDNEVLCRWEATPSCAQLIWNTIRHRNVRFMFRPELERVVAAAHMIDSAGYATPEQYFRAAEPEIAISHGFHRLTDLEKAETILLLMAGKLDEARNVAPEKLAEATTELAESLDRIASHMVRRGAVVLIDCVKDDLAFNRYAPYFYHPDARYAITIYRSGFDVRVGLGKNPWLGFEPCHLGNLAKTVGGGGHPFAAGALFRAAEHVEPYSNAWAFMTQAALRINEYERAAQAAVPRAA